MFSIAYEFFGSSAVAYALQIFAECILLDDRAWYVKALKREQHEIDQKSNVWWIKLRSWIEMQRQNLIPFFLCLLWLFGGALTAWFYIDIWNPFECVYFAFSSLATGGQQEIPNDSPKKYYLIGSDSYYFSLFLPPLPSDHGIVALYSAIGTPLMAYTLGSIASLFIVGPNIKVLEVIEKKINHDDLRTMQKYGLENRDGNMDRAEYLILCMLRLGVVDPELVLAIVKRYEQLDLSGDGLLSYKELLEQDDHEVGTGMRLKIKKEPNRPSRKRNSNSLSGPIAPHEKSKNDQSEDDIAINLVENNIVPQPVEDSSPISLPDLTSPPSLECFSSQPPRFSIQTGKKLANRITQLKQVQIEKSLSAHSISLSFTARSASRSPSSTRNLPKRRNGNSRQIYMEEGYQQPSSISQGISFHQHESGSSHFNYPRLNPVMHSK